MPKGNKIFMRSDKNIIFPAQVVITLQLVN